MGVCINMEKTHIFGELDLDLSKGPGSIYDEAFRIAEACGYYIELPKNESKIIVTGSDGEHATILFAKGGKIQKVTLSQTDDDDNIIMPEHEIEIVEGSNWK